ncbi:unnamed protein product [Rhizoctonia solani]|uniref:Uncharacterized protein n=1 Tax=Rhizoctonia solani TaxID=456999 RepID=A0A8H3CN92_9AGAM|nr:unnamed protein product [Rhizoctonia solani]
MLTGVDIASIVLASTGLGGSAMTKFANYTGKGGAWKTYDQVARQYTQLKVLREDVSVNQYLSTDDKEDLDESIEAIAFDLMELQSVLQELRGTAYYKITTYPAKWIRFNDRAELTHKLIVKVNIEIMQRSTQGREQARSGSTVQATSQPIFRSSSGEESVVINQGLASGDCEACFLTPTVLRLLNAVFYVRKIVLNRQIADATASSAAAALRLALEGGTKADSSVLGEDGGVNLPSGNRSVVEKGEFQGLKPGLKWQISPKAACDPPSLARAKDIELKDLAKEID